MKEGFQKFIIEYINSIACYAPIKIVTYRYPNQLPSKFGKRVIFVQEIPSTVNSRNIALLNTEQMTHPDKIRKFLKPVRVHMDYAHANLEYIHSPKFFVPYQVNDRELVFSKVPKTFDVAIINPRAPRRLAIVKEIRKRGIECKSIVGWGKQRDNEIAKARILLNIHHNNRFNVYEAIRCDRWVLNKTIVISEECLPVDDSIQDHIVFTPYDKLADTVERVVHNYKETHEQLYHNFDIEKIRLEKKLKLDKFRKNQARF